jgi:hypothetical protein
MELEGLFTVLNTLSSHLRSLKVLIFKQMKFCSTV